MGEPILVKVLKVMMEVFTPGEAEALCTRMEMEKEEVERGGRGVEGTEGIFDIYG